MASVPTPHSYSERLPAIDPCTYRWPDDYAVLDQGRLWIRPDVLPAFRQLGWTTLKAILDTKRCQLVRYVHGPEGLRDNCRVTLPGIGPIRAPIQGYLKRHWSDDERGWRQSQRQGMLWIPPGLAEADAVGACQRAEVSAMSVLAAGGENGERPGQAVSFFFSEAVDGMPADRFWLQRFGGVRRREDAADRLALIETLARIARKFHREGLRHRDFYWCHIFVSERQRGQFSARLIDLQRVAHEDRYLTRGLLKDVAQFVFSMPPDLSAHERETWFRIYTGQPSTRSLPLLYRTAWSAVRIRAAVYAWRERRHEGRR